MTAMIPSAGTRVVALSQIMRGTRAFPREGVDGARVDEFAGLYRDELPAGNDPLPPIGCVEGRDGRLVLYDRWHRVEARRRIAAECPGRGYDELAAEVVRAGQRDPVDYAYELAIECSAVSPKQLTQRERIAAAKRLSEIHPDWAAREIGRRLGISHQTVGRARGSIVRTENGPNGPSPDVANATGSDQTPQSGQAARPVTLEQRAWRAANALSQLFEQARQETRGMLGLVKPNLEGAGAGAYKALERSYGEDAPAVADDLLALVTAMKDQATKLA
jgi:hypothetical protein